jgi:hypothetical protein
VRGVEFIYQYCGNFFHSTGKEFHTLQPGKRNRTVAYPKNRSCQAGDSTSEALDVPCSFGAYTLARHACRLNPVI